MAVPYLHTRNNDSHSLFAHSLAHALLTQLPEANPEVVLPAILLHDVGWSSVSPELVLEAIAPGSKRKDLVLQHGKAGAQIAQEILSNVNYPEALIEEICQIIDGHDSRVEALSLNDSIVKDADKLWRLTPSGLNVIMNWFGLTREEALKLAAYRVQGKVFTEPAKAICAGLIAVESAFLSPQMRKLQLP